LLKKKTNKRKRKLQDALHKISTERKRHSLDEQEEVKQYNFEAMNLINDPQGYCEKVFGVLKVCKFGFDFKIRIMNLISRLINCHNLILEPFYSYIQKYAQPHQQYITQILSILAQACHNLVSPDILEPIIMSIANNFVSDRRPTEVIAIGLNTIREICIRCPLVMNATLLKDLILYKKIKDKSVMMAARSLIQLYRLVNPSLLPKKRERKKY
jgi:protein SDA1